MPSPLNIYRLFTDSEYPYTLSAKDWENAVLILRHESLLGRFAHRFLPLLDNINDPDLQAYLRTHLSNALTLAGRQNHSVQFECEEINKTLNTKGITPLYLKGAAYSLLKNNTHLGRTYGDIDLLVEKQQVESSERSLAMVGWIGKEVNDYDEKYYREWAHEIPPLCHGGRGTVADLHHNIVPLISKRAPDISQFTVNRVKHNGFEVLNPAAMTLHSAIHLFLNEDFTKGLRDLSDLDCLFREYGDSKFWAEIYTLAQTTHFEVELFLAMYFCRRHFDTPVDQETLNKLDTYSLGKKAYWRFIFAAAVGAKHPKANVSGHGLRLFLAYIRGHYLKMPPITLLKHLTVKGWMSVTELVLGKSYLHNKDELTEK